MKAAVLTKYRTIEVQDVPIPSYNDTEVLIKVAYAGICGSDQHIFNGDFHPRTRLPMIPGHEFAGTIVETGKSVKNFKKGDRVTVDPIIWCGHCPACKMKHYPACTTLKLIGVDMNGGFAEYVPADESMLYKIDNNITDIDGALIEVLSIGFHACKRAGLKKNDTVVIWGAGRIGHCILQAVRTITDNKIFIIDILDSRLELAKKNFDNINIINSKKENPIKIIKELTNNQGVDVAFEAVGHATPIQNTFHPVQGCIQSIHGAGVVCVLGLADDPVPVIFKELIWREAKIIASRVTHGEFSKTIQQLSKKNLKPDILISEKFTLDKTQEAFELLEKNPEKYLKILINISN
jgi:threonine dehydrogenase-like Zn-dependent dehydrogenase